jgi:hypothetical protein
VVGLDDKRVWFLITGIALLAMAVLSGFAFGYVYNEIYSAQSADLTLDKLNSNQLLFKFSIAAWLGIIALDILVSIGLYKIYHDANHSVAAISSGLRLVYTFILSIAVYLLAQPILANVDESNVLVPFESFISIWDGGLIIFGAHLVVLSVNCIKSDFTPKAIAVLLMIGGLSYILAHGLKVSLANGDPIATTAESLLIIPMALSELVFAIWLIYKYVKLREPVELKSMVTNT